MQIPVMFNDRDASLYSGPYSCVIWINLFQLFIRMSVALTATLSISRTRSLIWPLKTIHKKPIFIGLACYAIFIVLSVPATVKFPSANSISSSEASKVCAALFLPFSMTLSAAFMMAEPPTAMDREPYVPIPNGTRSVSP